MDKTIDQLKKLKVVCLYEKKKHFNAATRKSKYNLWIGIPLISFTVVSSSVLLYAIVSNASGWVKYVPLALSFVSAFLSSIQTFFNFSKQIEGHKSIGNRYLAAMKECELFYAFYQDKQLTDIDFKDKVLELYNKVQQVNKDSEAYSTNQNDYRKTKEGIDLGEEKYTRKELSM